MSEHQQHNSQLIPVLRETVAVVQMIFFKELKNHLEQSYPNKQQIFRAMLAGAIINRVFGVENPDPKFQEFSTENRAIIEQELLGLPHVLPRASEYLTDALRVMVLCDHQEGYDSGEVLLKAKDLGILQEDRETPLPSTFMTTVRKLGEEHGLTMAPQEVQNDSSGSEPH